MVLGDVVSPGCCSAAPTWHWQKLGGEVSAKDKPFYEGKVAAAQFFARARLPKVSAERAIAQATDLSLMDLDEAAF